MNICMAATGATGGKHATIGGWAAKTHGGAHGGGGGDVDGG